MTPRQKAEELLHKYWILDSDGSTSLFTDKSIARQCAIITIDEIIKELLLERISVYYWQLVKKEIEML